MLEYLFNNITMLFGNKISLIIAVLFFTIIFAVIVYVIGQVFVIKEILQNIQETNNKILIELKNNNNKTNHKN